MRGTRYNSYYYFFKQIRQQFVKIAIVPVLKKWAFQFAKQCLKLMAFLAGVMLMIIGLQSIMEQYNFAFHMNACVPLTWCNPMCLNITVSLIQINL